MWVWDDAQEKRRQQVFIARRWENNGIVDS